MPGPHDYIAGAQYLSLITGTSELLREYKRCAPHEPDVVLHIPLQHRQKVTAVLQRQSTYKRDTLCPVFRTVVQSCTTIRIAVAFFTYHGCIVVWALKPETVKMHHLCR